MIDENKKRQAKTTFTVVCKALDAFELDYRHHEDTLKAVFRYEAEQTTFDVQIQIDSNRSLILVHSPQNILIPYEKRKMMAGAITAINYTLNIGGFDYDFTTGKMYFRAVTPFQNSIIGLETIQDLLATVVNTVEKYSPKIIQLVDGVISLQDFMMQLESEEI
ncbi:MAG: YbjN domain-containing protein [Prevotella sp.]|nr:YbjN domain-containing protein [Staphylococcus sp.]MCM1350684.1 YbjN domain-containing protein [Prevotella sp.]